MLVSHPFSGANSERRLMGPIVYGTVNYPARKRLLWSIPPAEDIERGCVQVEKWHSLHFRRQGGHLHHPRRPIVD